MTLTSEALAILGILFTIAVAVFSFILGIRTTRPKLVGIGSGFGSLPAPNEGIMGVNLNISNDPSFWGIKVNREPATITFARLYDRSIREYVGPRLAWYKNGSRELEHECIIEPGKSKRLCVFAKERGRMDYFICPTTHHDSGLTQQVVKYNERKKDFSLHLRDTIGRKYRFEIVAMNAENAVSVNFKITWRNRWSMIVQALELLREAFTFK